MHPATLRGIGVITKLYFVIFAAFKESMTLTLAQRSFKVIEFGTNQKCVYIFPLVVNSNLDHILHRFRYTAAFKCRKSKIFLTPLLFCLKFAGAPSGVDSWCWGLHREERYVRIVSREIIFQELQPIWSRYFNVTDRQTDNLPWQYRALPWPSRLVLVILEGHGSA